MTFFEQLMQTCWDNFYQFFVTGPGENIHTPVNIWVTGNFNRRMHGKEGENDLWGIFCRLKCLPIAVSHVSRLTWHTNVTANIVCGKWDEKKNRMDWGAHDHNFKDLHEFFRRFSMICPWLSPWLSPACSASHWRTGSSAPGRLDDPHTWTAF